MDKTFNIFQIALKLAPLFLGYKPQTQKPRTILSEKDLALINLRQKKGSVIVLLGSRDTGKTELAYRLAEFLDRPTFAVSPQQKPPEWITWIKLDEVESRVSSRSTLLCDDLPSYMSSKDYYDSFVRAVEKVIPMVRHEPQPPEYPIGEVHLIFASQSATQADRYILDCDLALLKPLGLLLADIERPAIAKIYRTVVDPCFEGKDDWFIKTHAFMLSRTYKGLISFKKVT